MSMFKDGDHAVLTRHDRTKDGANPKRTVRCKISLTFSLLNKSVTDFSIKSLS